MATARWQQLGSPPEQHGAGSGGARFWLLEVPGDGRSTGG